MATVCDPSRIILAALSFVLFSSIGFGQTLPPLRGVYPLGMNSIIPLCFPTVRIHSTQKDTNIHPGETFNLDYSLMQNIPLRNDNGLQIGVVGYDQWQTTDTT